MRKTFDLGKMQADVLEYFESIHESDSGYGRYINNRASLLYASVDVAITRAVMGESLKSTLSEGQRRQWTDYINSFQNPDGTYEGSHHYWHRNGMVLGALGAIGGKQKYPVMKYTEFDTPEKLAPWFEGLRWHVAWSASHLIWGGPLCFSFSSQADSEWLNVAIDWLNRNLNPQTGWWKEGVEPIDWRQGLGCGSHVWPLYEHHGIPFPYPDAVIDSILDMDKQHEDFLNYPDYFQLDALYGLRYMGDLAPKHRQGEIEALVNRFADLMIKEYEPFLARAKSQSPHIVLAMVGAAGLLNQMIPDRFQSDIPWSGIFSDRGLYQTSSVEAA